VSRVEHQAAGHPPPALLLPLLAGRRSACRLGAAGVGETVGGAAGFDDLPGERQPVNNGGAQSRIGECLCPGREGLVGGNGDGRAFLPLSENLKQQFRAAPEAGKLGASWSMTSTAGVPSSATMTRPRPCLRCQQLTRNRHGRCDRCQRDMSGWVRKGSTRQWRKQRAAILERDGHRCHWCGGHADSVDHLKPKALGGSDDPTNLIASCGACNSGRTARIGRE
jgi:hypothetical protein